MRNPATRKFRIPARVAAPAFTAVLLGLVLLGAFAACKSKPPADVPGEFTFHGQAVHPAAVSALYSSSTGQIDLAAFKTNLEPRQWEDQPGWWVTDFEEDPASGRSPFFAYAAFAGPIGDGAEIYVLSVIFNQGETADVNNLVLLQKNGTWLSLIRTWNEGSACNGGISNQRMDNDNFLYSRELTPIDLLGLSAGLGLDLKTNEDLEATSESCFASANYRLQPHPGPRGPRFGPPLRRARAGREGPDRAVPLPVVFQPHLQRLRRPGQDRAHAQGSGRVRRPLQE